MKTGPAHAAAIEASLAIAAARGGDLTSRVFAHLFREQPHMEALFRRDRDGSIKGEMLARVFEAILDFIGDRSYADHLIQCEVITHEGYDVPRDVFSTFFPFVADVVRDACGPDWTPAMDEAWVRLLAELDYFVKHPDQAAVAT
jgi:hemoglobin-like flavoprotein